MDCVYDMYSAAFRVVYCMFQQGISLGFSVSVCSFVLRRYARYVENRRFFQAFQLPTQPTSKLDVIF